MCFHEAGHIEAAYLWGASVEKAVINKDDNTYARILHKQDLSTKAPVACGGYAAERLVFDRYELIDSLGHHISEKNFKIHAMNNAQLDKFPFYIKQPINNHGIYPDSPFQPNEDKTWPLESDDPFIRYAKEKISPELEKRFEFIEALANELDKKEKLTQAEIEQIRNT